MTGFLLAWLDWGWAWMLVGLAGYAVAVVVVEANDGRG